ncbi:IMP dehydrogenase [Candidatus Woesearchaeota archaeon]|nr:IMP dehydrogenase [Candidatus Woesearchaeota archaeon]
MELGLSYDDVLLVPKRSPIKSRKDVSTETYLTKKIKLKIPVVSSNMDTVTESGMAIEIAQLGGIGIIHRFNTIEQQIKEVERVKRYRSALIERPLIVKYSSTLEEAREIMDEKGITSLLVVDGKGKLTGILTARDIRFKPPLDTKVSELMTPKEKLVVGKKGISPEEAKNMMMKSKVEKLPVVDNDWNICGLYTGKDIYRKTKHPDSTVDSKDRLMVGAAVGVKEDAIQRAKKLVEAGADVLVIDIAHGHSDLEIDVLKKIKKELPDIEIIAGNVATAEGTKDLIEAGADAVKVGVGPGSICTTRIVTGSGYPQLSAVMNCAKEAAKHGIPVIADGGIKFSGDITKAIAAGASTVMLGSLLAGTDESPGDPIIKNGKKFKVIRGMASFGAKFGRDAKEKTSTEIMEFVPEGVEATVPYKGNVSEIVHQLMGGLRSGMSYCGAMTIKEVQEKGEFVRITSAGLKESHAHDVNLV